MAYGVFTVNGIDRETYLTYRDDDTPVVFATEAEAISWAQDNYPDFFLCNPNGWQSFGFDVEEICDHCDETNCDCVSFGWGRNINKEVR